jgi:hypothetical protein
MSWSLRLQHGDLLLSGAGLATTTGASKLAQDLRCYILEEMGLDDMHPDYGSTLNGATLADGTNVPGVIGITDPQLAQTELEVEMRRIVNAYQANQLARAKADRLRFGKATLTRGEALLQLSGIDQQRVADTLYVTLKLVTVAQTQLSIALAFNLQ